MPSSAPTWPPLLTAWVNLCASMEANRVGSSWCSEGGSSSDRGPLHRFFRVNHDVRLRPPRKRGALGAACDVAVSEAELSRDSLRYFGQEHAQYRSHCSHCCPQAGCPDAELAPDRGLVGRRRAWRDAASNDARVARELGRPRGTRNAFSRLAGLKIPEISRGSRWNPSED